MGRILSGVTARSGRASKVPRDVQYTFGSVGLIVVVAHVAVEVKPGRSLNTESPFRSFGDLMLNGDPELAIMNGLSRKAYGKAIVPPKKRRCLTSKDPRP